MSKNIENQKEFGLSTWSVNNRKTVYLIIAMIMIMGVGAYTSMPKENFPELQIPEIYVGVPYPGNSPKLIADKITDPIEKELNSIKNVDEIKSNSIDGYASIQVKFDFKVTAKQALQEVKDAVDKAQSSKGFPTDLPAEPNIFEMDVSEMPIMNINLSGDYSIEQLKGYAEILEDMIEELPEISEVEIRGTQEQEMQIMVDPKKANAVDVTFGDIQNAIANENINMSGGEYLDGTTKRTIQIEGKFKNAAEIGEVIVKQEDYKPVYLKDVAEIEFADADTTSYAREWGQTVVMLDIKKRGGENLLAASDKIMQILKDVREQKIIPETVHISVTNDQSDKTREMVSNLENSIIFGVLLVVGVLLFFLGLRNSLFVGVAIPLSMFMSFMILQGMGVTLNLMVLFSLVLALGMLVDNGIVVVENVQRLMEEGHDGFTAARKGVGEIAWPIIASTATTLGAFVPLAFWPGMMGEFMKYLPITLIIVLGSSLFVALVINPVLTAMYMRVEKEAGNRKRTLIIAGITAVMGILVVGMGKTGLGNLMILLGFMAVFTVFALNPATVWFQEKFLPKLEALYENLLRYALKGRRPVWFFVGMFGMLFISFVVVGLFTPKVSFFPENQPQYVNIFIQHPIGTDIKVTNQTTLEIERIINEEILVDEIADTVGVAPKNRIIQSIISQVGEGTSDPSRGVQMGQTPHKARITINFCEFKHRSTKNKDYHTGEILKKISDGLKNRFPADVQINVEKNQFGPPTSSPINIEVFGQVEYDSLIAEAERIRLFLDRKNVAGVDKLKLDVETGKPELQVEIDRAKARLFNVSTGQIGNAIRTALFGADISTFKVKDETYDIVTRFDKSDRHDLDALLDQRLIFRNNKGRILRIPIRSLIKEPKPTQTYSTVVHKDLVPLVTVYSGVSEGYNANETVAEIKKVMEEYKQEYDMNPSIDYKFTGEQEEQAEEMAFLSKALGIAVFLILLVIVGQFNSFSTPAIIMFAVVFSFIGVLFGLVIFQMPFVIMMTMIGIISLAGVVVNNAIVLIDYTNLLRKRMREERGIGEFEQLTLDDIKEAITIAGKTRLRPVLLTAITTVLGLIPLALGINIDFTTLLTEYNANFYMGGDNTLFFGPMSWTIIFGLTFATFLTLIIIPVMYLLFYRFKLWLFKITNQKMRTNL
ncbi:efflux RND transporter permease subunit [Paracrocinitomix mangrovi]|uniref:efflux RND transporter permease subunit n=1 Tax=Paracrocinitomix mangrovi TaxID=2862509 RepID=UPI001C8D65F2|nr:efflux RND transporter permease subunit [Paracrocinitomix mangrovi]UKN01952.1 efflux RND transporter permease subunit [Paracrocinitomix mangrovi]